MLRFKASLYQCSLEYASDGVVSGADRLDRGVKHACNTQSRPKALAAHTTRAVLPVCPTMSGGAKLHMMKGYFPLSMALITSVATSCTDISGFRSYVGTLGDGTSTL